MSWSIWLFEPTGTTVTEYRDESRPLGVSGDINWTLAPTGNCLSASFTVDATRFPVRGTLPVQIHVDKTPWFFGFVAEAPSPRDPNWGEVKLDGAYRLLEKRRIGVEVFRDMDVGAIARALVEKYRHPAVGFDPELIPDTGYKVSQFTLPYRKLSEALDTLSKLPAADKPIPFGVLPDRSVFFGRVAAQPAIASYSEAKGLRWLRVTTDDVVTKAFVIALNKSSGAAPTAARISPDGQGLVTAVTGERGHKYASGGLPYRAATYTNVAELAGYADVGWEDARLAPAGADIFSNVMADASVTQTNSNMATPEGATDGNAATSAASTGEGAESWLQYSQAREVNASPIVGFRVLYSLDLKQDAHKYHAEVTQDYRALFKKSEEGNTVGFGQTYATFDFALPDTGGLVREVTAITPLPRDFADANFRWPFTPSTLTPYATTVTVNCAGIGVLDEATGEWIPPKVPADAFRVYAVELLAYDRLKVDAIARKLLIPPASVPTEFTLGRLLPPSTECTLANAPGGDLTGRVAEFGYTHGPNSLRTSHVRLEQPGASETARVIRLAAQAQALDAQTQLRAFLEE